MGRLDLLEVSAVLFCGALGLLWTFVGIAAYTLNMPPPALDPLGVLRTFIFAPFYGTLYAAFLLHQAGIPAGSDTDPMGFVLLCGVGAGLLAGLALVLANRRWSFV